MHIPPTYDAAGPAIPGLDVTSQDGILWIFKGKGKYPENWSSLIGIITAITGNVLISFALNMQRYAHIRLDREWQEKERQRKSRNASSASLARLAEENGKSRNTYRSRQNDDYTRLSIDDDLEATESDPLIPQSPDRSNHRPSFQRDDRDEDNHESKQKSYLKSPYWWLGIILMTTGEAGNFLAYGFAPASIVSPLGVVALISNCIIAPFMLKEPFRKRDFLGVIIAVGGAVTVVLSANDSNPKLGPDKIWDLIRRWEFETYLGITVAVITGLMVASNRFGEKNILIDLGLVGLFGGYTALSTKGVASLLSYSLWRVITFPVFYLLVAILVGTAVMQIKYVNRALQRFDATQVIPVQFVLFTLSVIGGSAILYRDFERTSGEDAGKFVGGCALTFFGVWLITSGRPRRDNDEEDREPEPEDAINLVEDRYRDDIDAGSQAGSSRRRSSTLRDVSPPINIRSRYRDEQGSCPTTPTRKAANIKPKQSNDCLDNVDATNSTSGEPLVPDGAPQLRTPPFARHTSTPVLPSEAAPPPLVSASDPELAFNLSTNVPQTPIRGKSHDEAPTTPGTAQSALRRMRTNERVGTLSRNSIPGPLLASPLSTSLSAMVQDLKRGGNIRNKDIDGTPRRRESVLGLGTEELDGSGIGEPLERQDTQNNEARSEQGAASSGRNRSLSGTLNDLWRGLRGQGSKENIGQEASASHPSLSRADTDRQ